MTTVGDGITRDGATRVGGDWVIPAMNKIYTVTSEIINFHDYGMKQFYGKSRT